MSKKSSAYFCSYVPYWERQKRLEIEAYEKRQVKQEEDRKRREVEEANEKHAKMIKMYEHLPIDEQKEILDEAMQVLDKQARDYCKMHGLKSFHKQIVEFKIVSIMEERS